MDKPVPKPNSDTQAYWDACAEGKLLYQACRTCATIQTYPRSHCAQCQSNDLEWHQSAGGGSVYSHTTVLRAPTPAFKDEVPYVIALVQLDEGFRLMVNILDCDPANVQIGRKVRIVYRPARDGFTLPQGVLA